MDYNSFRHFADSWGLVYIFSVFILVILMVFLPGAKKRANEAANIPLQDETPLDEELRP